MTKSDLKQIKKWVEKNKYNAFPYWTVNSDDLLAYLKSLVGVCEWKLIFTEDETGTGDIYTSGCVQDSRDLFFKEWKHCPYCSKEIEIKESEG